MDARHAYLELRRFARLAFASRDRAEEEGDTGDPTGRHVSQADTASGSPKHHLRAGRHREQRYATRFLLSLSASLLLMIAAAHLPIGAGWDPVGWYVIRPAESISVDIVEPVMRQPTSQTGAPITRQEDENAPSRPEGDLDEEQQKPSEDVLPATVPAPERVSGRRVFETAHTMPRVLGGLGAYYIHIEYPEEAVRAGVQGRLLLSFVVETDGRTTGVEVVRSLHPACDSAAVRALRQTRFVPGRQEGEIVPVRMRLPVRFQIVDREDGLAAAKDAEG